MGIELRHKTYFFRMTVPKDVRAKLGKRMFRASLKTDRLPVAEVRAAIQVAEWKAQIEAARGNPSTNNATWRPVLAPARRRATELHVDGSGRTRGEVYDLEREPSHDRAMDIEYRLAAIVKAPAKSIATDAYVGQWLAASDVSPSTKAMQRGAIARFAGALPVLQSVDRPGVLRWLAGLDNLSSASVRRITSAVRGYWRHLERHGHVPEGSGFLDKLPPVRRRGGGPLRQPFAPADVVRLWRAATAGGDVALADLIWLAAHTGCRIEELTSLQVADVDLPTSGEMSLTIRSAKGKGSVRVVPVHSAIRELVARLIEGATDGYVFSGQRADQFGKRRHALGQRFSKLRTAEGFGAEVVFHSIRKTMATMLEHAGVGENVAADILGHEKPRLTYGLYSGGASLGQKRAALELVRYSPVV